MVEKVYRVMSADAAKLAPSPWYGRKPELIICARGHTLPLLTDLGGCSGRRYGRSLVERDLPIEKPLVCLLPWIHLNPTLPTL